MKSILVLFLWGVVLCAARPQCTDEEVEKCAEGTKGYDFAQRINTEEELDRYCSIFLGAIECQVALIEKCPNLSIYKDLESGKERRRELRKACDKSSPFRKMIIENLACLNDFVSKRKADEYCRTPITIQDEDKCKKLKDRIKCIDELLVKECDHAARDVYFDIEDPYFELRQEHCL